MPDKFDELMDQWDESQAEKQRDADTAKAEREAFIDRFEKWVERVCEPALQAVAERVRSRGHNAEVTRASVGGAGNELVQFRCAPRSGREQRAFEMSSLRFSASRTNEHVSVGKTVAQAHSTSSGREQDHPLDELTAERVQELAMGLVEETFTPR
jgi:hypothetical protein